jgi:heterodisulfide reductase subunit D
VLSNWASQILERELFRSGIGVHRIFLPETREGNPQKVTRCGKCLEACPMTGPAQVDLTDPSFVIGGILELLEGKAGNGDARKWAKACTGSGLCIPACDYGINPRFMMRLANAKVRALDANGRPTPKAVATFNAMSKGVTALAKLQLNDAEGAKAAPELFRAKDSCEDKPDIVFYTGCNVLRTPHILLLCLDVLDALGIRAAIHGGSTSCCGIVHFMSGDLASAGRMGSATANKLASHDAPVITWCPSCQTHLGEMLLTTLARAERQSVDPLPFFEFLLQHKEKLTPLFKNPVRKTIALDERPALPKAVAAIKDILAMIEGLTVVELDVELVGIMSNYLNALPAYKADLRSRTVDAARSAGVDAFVTLFHACHREICHFEGQGYFEVLNVMDILGEAMGIEHPDQYKAMKLLGDPDTIMQIEAARMEARGIAPEMFHTIITTQVLND